MWNISVTSLLVVCLSPVLLSLGSNDFKMSPSEIKDIFTDSLEEIIHEGHNLPVVLELLNATKMVVPGIDTKTLLDSMAKTTTSTPFAKRQTHAGFMRKNGAIGLESSKNGRVIDAAANVALKVSQNLRQKINKVNPTLTSSPMEQLESIKAPAEFCPFQNVQGCDPNSRYRTVDGSCNNLQNPWWGKSEIPYTRILPPAYDDGILMPRAKSATGQPLPNPREISLNLCTEVPDVEQFYTHILPIFGQFLAHDITSVSVSTGKTLIKFIYPKKYKFSLKKTYQKRMAAS